MWAQPQTAIVQKCYQEVSNECLPIVSLQWSYPSLVLSFKTDKISSVRTASSHLVEVIFDAIIIKIEAPDGKSKRPEVGMHGCSFSITPGLLCT